MGTSRIQTKEDLIEALRLCARGRKCRECPLGDVFACKAALMPRWIPVSERLPDGRDSILALTGDCDFYVCDYIPSVKQFWTIPGDELHIDDITHWMPLPEPPKEG